MTTTQKLIQPKMGLLKLAEKLGNVSEALYSNIFSLKIDINKPGTKTSL